ncbi:MAG: MlaD family protein [Solirubrobacterales bacterium]
MTLHGGREKGMSRRRAGAVAIVVISILVYFAFSKDIPFTNGYQVNAYFDNAVNIQPKSPVRISGVNVGKVSKVVRDKGSSRVKLVMDLDDDALPIHTDATAKIRFRIFLEGNAFVDLRPGSPSAPTLEEGDTIPLAQTASPVQLDQLLAAVNKDARDGLASIFTEIGTALDTVGTPEENRTQDPDVKNLTGGQALNRALRYGPEGFKGGARIFDALVGYDEDDQIEILRGFRDFNKAFNDREAQLVPLISDFATTFDAFASDEAALQESTKQFSRLIYESEPTLRNLNAMLPRLTTFANEIAPNLKEIPEMVEAANPWIDETTALLAKAELGTTASLSRSTFSNFAKVSKESQKTLPELNRLARCWTDVWQPTLMKEVPDGPTSSGVENYKDFWYSLVGMAGESQNFNANGRYLRLAAGSASGVRVPSGQGSSELYGPSARPEIAVRPGLPAKNPQIRDDIPCYKNGQPNLAPTAQSK